MVLGSLIGVLVAVVILLVVWWAVHQIADATWAPRIVTTILDVLLVVGFVAYILSAVKLLTGWRLR